MEALLILGLLAAAAWAYSQSEAEAQERPGRARDDFSGVPLCDLPPSQIVELSGTQLRAWVDCPGRRDTEVQQAVNLLYARDTATAGALLDRWRARRRIEDSPPTGTVSPDTRRRVGETLNASAADLAGPAYEPGPMSGVDRNGAGTELSPPGGRTAPPAPGGETPAPVTTDGYDPARARQLAGPLARHIRDRGGRYDRQRVRDFQAAAGFVPLNRNGFYDCVTRNALVHFGINSPPNPLHGITANCDRHPYQPPARS